MYLGLPFLYIYIVTKTQNMTTAEETKVSPSENMAAIIGHNEAMMYYVAKRLEEVSSDPQVLDLAKQLRDAERWSMAAFDKRYEEAVR